MNSTNTIVVVTLIVVVAAVAFWGLSGVHAPSPFGATPFAPTPTTTQNTVHTPAKVQIALLDTQGTSQGYERGCDKVVMQERTVPATDAVLTAAMQALFAEDREHIGTLFSYIARTNDTLHFDHATVENGVAKIYLTGQLTGLAGVCDDPRAAIQIEETALQFTTVKSVEIYLNGTKTTLVPSER